MICWYIIRTETGKEAHVNRACIRQGLETYLPMEVRSYRPSRHTKRRVCVEVPLIPRVVFAAFSGELPKLRYVTGLQRDAVGETVAIPQAQMLRFIACHQEWLAEAISRARTGKPGGSARVGAKKRKWRSLDSPGVLETIMRDYFGTEEADLTESEFHGKRAVHYA